MEISRLVVGTYLAVLLVLAFYGFHRSALLWMYYRNWHRRPLAAGRVLSLIADARGGRMNDPRFGHRMKGGGAYAEMIGKRFSNAARRLGLGLGEADELDLSQFRVPHAGGQLGLF